MAHRTTKLKKTLPESLRYKRPEPSPLVRARTHDKKAEALRTEDRARRKDGDTDPTRPHLQYLERMKALMAATEPMAEQARKEYRAKLAQDDIGAHHILGHLIATLPSARLERIMKMEEIGKLNRLLMKPGRKIQKVIDDNEDLDELDIHFKDFVAKKRDLKFALGLQGYKSGQALGLYFVVLWKAADPKVRKKANLVQDQEVLDLANTVLREVATHIIEEMQLRKDKFFDVGKRKDDALMAKGGRKV